MRTAEWVATYRLQLHAEFTLAHAAEVLPYLAALGISHVYLSPVLQAASGSTHGYDVADPSRVSDALGGEAAWEHFCAATRRHGLGVLLDIVPNHMTTDPANPWWSDVLEHGPHSRFARFFDLDPEEDGGRRVLHLCELGCRYGEALRRGELGIEVSEERIHVVHHGRRRPLNPLTWHLLTDGDWHDGRPPPRAGAYADAVEEARALWRERFSTDPEGVEARVRATAVEPAALHRVLERQFFRLHWWKLEGERINYRRFFDIGGLVGARVEDDVVFHAAHERVLRMVREGQVQGLRIDHPDGLRDPVGYLRKLRAAAPGVGIWVEKILDASEHLPRDWPVEGTVGYDFLSKANRLWMAEHHADTLTSIYADFTGHPTNFPALVRERKHAVLDTSFSGDLERLVRLATRCAESDWSTADVSRRQLARAIAVLTTVLPVYRTYVTSGSDDTIATEDLRILHAAFDEARAQAPEVDAGVFDLLHTLLTKPATSDDAREFTARWQQLAPAVMAKGVEDTSFYLYDRLVSCNEVGAQPTQLGIPTERFHEFCHHLQTRWPRTLLATSTHDNKRSEDVRTRISILSEIPSKWAAAVRAWSAMNEPAWQGRAPDRHAEYLLYQTLVGAWPIGADRVDAYMVKACREAKAHTSWHEPDETYESSVRGFVAAVLASGGFVRALESFVEPLVAAGRVNSLAQTTIKLTAPGIPDFYQGTELWDSSLVDPDNRRPVDFAQRTRLLTDPATMDARRMRDMIGSGIAKLWLIRRLLQLRPALPTAFGAAGEYLPLASSGSKVAHLLAFRRADEIVVAVPRFVLSLEGDWSDTLLHLPPGSWRGWLDGGTFRGVTSPAALFAEFPVSVLVRDEAATAEEGGRSR
ncbi:malto-oligosyltrehalose synthase [Opitutales bacterium ASA1]|uniref:malto-oligosyltrehalose synthase n=1 Tax=Congregicoccus parvus TaxID=3081749 RepID=UPI002B2D140C|nr:malto-oligosyltrehalose synthase [Opitutales bacterium ASA1]